MKRPEPGDRGRRSGEIPFLPIRPLRGPLGTNAGFLQALSAGILSVSTGLGHATPLPDPTQPWDAPPASVVPAGAARAPYQLHAVLIGGGRRQAIINGRLLREGDTLDGLRVTSIRAQGVRLEGSQGTQTLRLPSIPITQPSRVRP